MYVSAWAIAVALHLSLARAVATREPSTCEALEADLPGRVAYPGTLDYTTSNHYWSARQSGLSPPCFVRPTTALEVSEALKLLTASRSPFTVKAGGHTAFGTGSSIRDGVTIDLAAMNSITVSPDRSTVSIGPGARWLNVSQALDPLGLAVVGGRSPDVGVSGLILGGGISFLSGRRGWACDNVQNFEIVLASGEIVNANARQHSDLYRALRGGGGSSFGVVTRFDLDAYEQGDVWGGLTIWPESEASDVIGTFLGISRDVLHTDEDVHLFIVLGYLLGTNDPVVAAFAWHLNHLEPPNGSFDTFEGLARLPGQMSNQTWVAPISDQIKTLWEPYGNRKTWWDTTVSDGAGSNILFDEIIALWKTYAKEIRAAGEERGTVVNPGLAIQPITSTTREAMKRNGGNALGLEPGEAPLFLVHAPVSWTDRSLDCLIEERTKRFIAAVDQLADEKGFGNGFKYMNYAGKTEDVFASYGAENKQRLLSVAQKYDPDGLLRDLWERYFKVY